jgi:hypothetical protein
LNLLKCRHCGERKDRSTGIKVPLGFFCSYEHATSHGKEKASALRNKESKASLRVRKKALVTRPQWFTRLQKVKNQYVVHVRDKDLPCFTCGTTSQSIKYDCGHYIHAGSGGGDRRRFVDINLHKQCSVQCNQHGGGMPEVYAQVITSTYGLEKLTWLKAEVNHPTLKELFPHWTDIEIEINRYRKLLRDNGLKPNA